MNTTWNVDPTHSEIEFKVKHMMITNVNGSFESFRAHAKTEGDDFSGAYFEFEADVNSISTGVADRDGHLMSDDFFNAETYPLLTFTSTNVVKNGDDLIIDGEMTIRDVKKNVQLKGEFGGIAVDPYGQTKAGMTISGKINRKDFGLKWSAITEAGSIVVSDEVRLHTELQFVRQ